MYLCHCEYNGLGSFAILQKIGYNIELTREGFEKYSKMFMLRKKL
jgi:hypothetical protein